MMESLSPTSRALSLSFIDPGVPLRSTPGFMLSPRFAGLIQTLQPLDQSLRLCSCSGFVTVAKSADVPANAEHLRGVSAAPWSKSSAFTNVHYSIDWNTPCPFTEAAL